MDLYEALKSGASEEELLQKFHKELSEAKEQYDADRREEEAAANQKELDITRSELAHAIVDYYLLLLGDENSEDYVDLVEETVEALIAFENMPLGLISSYINLPKSKSKEKKKDNIYKIKFSTDQDDKIIRDFLKNL